MIRAIGPWALSAFLTACGGDFDHDGRPSADPRCLGPTDAGTSIGVQASTATTACLQALCVLGGDVTPERPVEVVYANGGILLGEYSCPVGCCTSLIRE